MLVDRRCRLAPIALVRLLTVDVVQEWRAVLVLRLCPLTLLDDALRDRRSP